MVREGRSVGNRMMAGGHQDLAYQTIHKGGMDSVAFALGAEQLVAQIACEGRHQYGVEICLCFGLW